MLAYVWIRSYVYRYAWICKKLWSPFTKPRLVFDRCFTAACGKVLIEATSPFFVGYASNQRLYHIYVQHIIPYYPIYIYIVYVSQMFADLWSVFLGQLGQNWCQHWYDRASIFSWNDYIFWSLRVIWPNDRKWWPFWLLPKMIQNHWLSSGCQTS